MINVVKDLSKCWYELLNKFYLPQIKSNNGLPVGVLFYLDFDFNRNKYIQVIK
jgi:hypothetical protein